MAKSYAYIFVNRRLVSLLRLSYLRLGCILDLICDIGHRQALSIRCRISTFSGVEWYDRQVLRTSSHFNFLVRHVLHPDLDLVPVVLDMPALIGWLLRCEGGRFGECQDHWQVLRGEDEGQIQGFGVRKNLEPKWALSFWSGRTCTDALLVSATRSVVSPCSAFFPTSAGLQTLALCRT